MVNNRKNILSETKTRHIFWKNGEVKILTDLWLKDVPADYISQVLKRSPNAIEVKAIRIGLGSRRSEGKLVKKAKENKGRVRACMSCETLFYSTHAGNRICSYCKEHPVWKSGHDLHLTFEEIDLD